MKKIIIGALVGGILLFIAQFLSWGALNLHEVQQRYTPKQDSVMAYLNTQFTEDGGYMMPNFAPGTPDEEMKKQMTAMEGKPWVMLSYHKSRPGMNTVFMNMARGLAVNIIIMLLLCWLLVKIPSPTFGTLFLATLGTGLIVFLNAAYTQHIWYESFDLGAHLIDVVMGWGVVALWLGWWLSRGKK